MQYEKELDFGIVQYDVSVLGNVTIKKVSNQKGPDNPSQVIFPQKIDGGIVRIIGPEAFSNYRCNTLVLPENIILQPRAFANSKVKKLHAPGVTSIPSECFASSWISELIGTENVTFVGNGAFKMSQKLEHFHWFPSCPYVPDRCFEDSGIDSIDGFDNDTTMYRIGVSAFHRSQLKEITISSSVNLEHHCFAHSTLNHLKYNGHELILPASALLGCEEVNISGCDIVRVKRDISGQKKFWNNIKTDFDALVIMSE